MLNNFEYHHHLENDFYFENKLNQKFLVLIILNKPVFVAKFACANLAAKFSAVNLISYKVVIYLS